MARDYARIFTMIWKNAAFRALGESDQRLYLLLVTQPDIDAAGVLRVSLEWWADMAPDSRPENLSKSLDRLEHAHMVAVDRLAGEVLVRTFIKHDGGYHNPKRKPVIVRAVAELRSDKLAELIARQVQDLGVPELMEGRQPGSLSKDLDPAGPEGDGWPPDDDPAGRSFSQVECLPGSEPGSEPGSRRVSTTGVGREETTTHNPQPTTQPTGRRTEAAAADAALEIDEGFEEFWALYPRKIKKLAGRKAWRAARRRKVPARQLIEAVRRHAAAWLLAGTEDRYIPHPSTWLNSGAYNDEPEQEPPPSVRGHLRLASGGTAAAPRRTPTTTERVQAALEHLDPAGD